MPLDMSPLRTPSPDTHLVAFSAQLDAANNGTVIEGARAVASVTHTGTGAYDIALKSGWYAEIGSVLGLKVQTAIDLKVQEVGTAAQTVTTAGGKKISARLLTVGAAADPPAKGTNSVVLTGILVLRYAPNAS